MLLLSFTDRWSSFALMYPKMRSFIGSRVSAQVKNRTSSFIALINFYASQLQQKPLIIPFLNCLIAMARSCRANNNANGAILKYHIKIIYNVLIVIMFSFLSIISIQFIIKLFRLATRFRFNYLKLNITKPDNCQSNPRRCTAYLLIKLTLMPNLSAMNSAMSSQQANPICTRLSIDCSRHFAADSDDLDASLFVATSYRCLVSLDKLLHEGPCSISCRLTEVFKRIHLKVKIYLFLLFYYLYFVYEYNMYINDELYTIVINILI